MNKIFKRYSFLLLFLLLMLPGCAKEDSDLTSATGSSPFIGLYNFHFINGISGSTLINIDGNGAFDFPITVRISGSTTFLNIKGIVKQSGVLDASAKQDTTSFGVLTGQFYNGEGSGYLIGSEVALWQIDYIR